MRLVSLDDETESYWTEAGKAEGLKNDREVARFLLAHLIQSRQVSACMQCGKPLEHMCINANCSAFLALHNSGCQKHGSESLTSPETPQIYQEADVRQGTDYVTEDVLPNLHSTFPTFETNLQLQNDSLESLPFSNFRSNIVSHTFDNTCTSFYQDISPENIFRDKQSLDDDDDDVNVTAEKNAGGHMDLNKTPISRLVLTDSLSEMSDASNGFDQLDLVGRQHCDAVIDSFAANQPVVLIVNTRDSASYRDSELGDNSYRKDENDGYTTNTSIYSMNEVARNNCVKGFNDDCSPIDSRSSVELFDNDNARHDSDSADRTCTDFRKRLKIVLSRCDEKQTIENNICCKEMGANTEIFKSNKALVNTRLKIQNLKAKIRKCKIRDADVEFVAFSSVEENTDACQKSVLRLKICDTNSISAQAKSFAKHDGQKEWRCSLCSLVFSHEVEMNCHRNTCVQCSICNLHFSSVCEAKVHKTTKSHYEDGKRSSFIYACTECGKEFDRYKSMLKHYVTHMETLPYQCNLCTKSFPGKKQLQRHERKHHFKCEICSLLLCRRLDYVRHCKKNHTKSNERSVLAAACRKRAQQKPSRSPNTALLSAAGDNDRGLMHHEDSPSSNLHNRVLGTRNTHGLQSQPFSRQLTVTLSKSPKSVKPSTGSQKQAAVDCNPKKRAFCRFCSKLFKTEAEINMHLKMKHLLVQCQKCSKHFLNEHGMMIHHSKVHKTSMQFSCTISGPKFRNEQRLQKHASQVHFIHCQLCSKYFSTQRKFKDHVKKFHGSYKCRFCETTFRARHILERHLNSVHLSGKPYSCQRCPTAFICKDTLERHVQFVHHEV